MNPTTVVPKNLVMLARMLERLERSTVAVAPDQYRAVVEHLAAELRALPNDAAVDAVLDSFPATAELYENLQYQWAGLCRSPLAQAMKAELDARSAIEAARAASQAKR